MGYYMRVLVLSPKKASLGDLQKALDDANLPLKVTLKSDSADWTNLGIEGTGEHTIAALEYNPVVPGALGEAEIGEFLESIERYRPASAVNWLKAFLPKVKAVYAFQVLSGARALTGGWEAIWSLMDYIRKEGLGITQADGEGFSNLYGSHILWQFSEKASGEYRMAVLRKGLWTSFTMDLGDLDQRESFFNGEVPDGAEMVDSEPDLEI